MSKDIANRTIWLLVIVFILLLITFCGTYAYFSANLIEGENIKKSVVQSGILSTTFETGEYINNTEGQLIDEDQVPTLADFTSFSVYHNDESTTNALYNVSLTDITISENLINKDFKWELINNKVIISQGDFSNISSESDYLLNTTPINLPNGNTDDLVLRIWLQNDDNRNQNNLLNGSFEAKVKIDVVATK